VPGSEYRIRKLRRGVYVFVVLDGGEVTFQSEEYGRMDRVLAAAWDHGGPFDGALVYEGEGEWTE
jgi:hypothetical protein